MKISDNYFIIKIKEKENKPSITFLLQSQIRFFKKLDFYL